ncbi:hypothetical protein NHF48_013950 [Sphingomonas sp. H160509]|uniref:hypothetical protein n=1 Tax=Sphingomonas sp. H160509 TaxID=2955313 RepID=UPI0020978CE0|nr:hypothetical protein [Sphingomonas sp. H160509]MDD1451816.1 hypothetical protein [Sphingomonas sp. H160509]
MTRLRRRRIGTGGYSGRTVAEKAADAAAKTRIEKTLDGAKLDSTSDTLQE